MRPQCEAKSREEKKQNKFTLLIHYWPWLSQHLGRVYNPPTHTHAREHIPARKSTHVLENHIQAHTFLIRIHGCGRRSCKYFSIRVGQHSCPREEATINLWIGCCWNQRRGLDAGHQEEPPPHPCVCVTMVYQKAGSNRFEEQCKYDDANSRPQREHTVAACVARWRERSHSSRTPDAQSLKPRLMSTTAGLPYRKYYNYTQCKLQHTETDHSELCHHRETHSLSAR